MKNIVAAFTTGTGAVSSVLGILLLLNGILEGNIVIFVIGTLLFILGVSSFRFGFKNIPRPQSRNTQPATSINTSRKARIRDIAGFVVALVLCIPIAGAILLLTVSLTDFFSG